MTILALSSLVVPREPPSPPGDRRASLTLLFALLAVGNITGNHALLTFAGYEGIICGASAIYLAMAEVLNEQYGRTVLPIGEPAPARVAASPVTA